MNKFSFWKHFNWRILLLRIVVNGLALLLTALLVPKIYFVDRRLWVWLILAVAMGILNAVIKPIIQFLTLRFIFATYGLVVVLINAILLGLLEYIFPGLFAVESIFWALVGGAVFGIFAAVFESLLGLSPPIVSEKSPEIRQQLQLEQRNVLEEYLKHKEAEKEAAADDPALEGSSGKKQNEAATILAAIEGGSPPPAPAAEPSLAQPDSAASRPEPPTTDQGKPVSPALANASATQSTDDVISASQEA